MAKRDEPRFGMVFDSTEEASQLDKALHPRLVKKGADCAKLSGRQTASLAFSAGFRYSFSST
jgi:hypothetical protein